MGGPAGDDAEVLWSREGEAWVGVLGGDPDRGAVWHDGHEVEVLPRAEDRRVEVSHAPSGGFERRHVRAADDAEPRAKAADLPHAFRTNAGGRVDDDREGCAAVQGEAASTGTPAGPGDGRGVEQPCWWSATTRP